MDRYEQKIVDDVARVGWSLICVRDDPVGPGFVYSIGMMHTLAHPEVIMFGLDIQLMAKVINGIGREIGIGRRFDEPGLYDGLIENFACKFLPISAKQHPRFLGYAMWHRRYVGLPGDLRTVQCFWPDKSGHFPDEEGCNGHVAQLQPRLQAPPLSPDP